MGGGEEGSGRGWAMEVVGEMGQVKNVENKGGDEIRESVPNTKDGGTTEEGIGIIIPNGVRGVKGWTTNKTNSKEGLMIAFLMPLKVMFAGC